MIEISETGYPLDMFDRVAMLEGEEWPTEEQTVISEPVQTTVLASPPPPVAPLPRGDGPGDRIGFGMLVGIALVAAVAAVIAVVMLIGRDSKHAATPATTVVVTTRAARTARVGTQPARVSVAVPDLVGQTGATAALALKNEGFTARIVTVPGPAPKGQVIAESPAPGRSEPSGSTVRINVSNGAAEAAPATTPAATPATSSPAATTVAAATTVQQQQPASAQVPALSGDVRSAVEALSRAGLLASLQYVPGSEPLGAVENQGPAGGSTAPAGSHVTINASSGPGQKTQETVPDANGQTIPQAVSTMQHAGLRLIFLKRLVSDRSLAGKVVEQTPAAGTTAPKNAQVLVYMGAYKQ